MISDSTKALDFEEIVDIEFVFANGNKQKGELPQITDDTDSC